MHAVSRRRTLAVAATWLTISRRDRQLQWFRGPDGHHHYTGDNTRCVGSRSLRRKPCEPDARFRDHRDLTNPSRGGGPAAVSFDNTYMVPRRPVFIQRTPTPPRSQTPPVPQSQQTRYAPTGQIRPTLSGTLLDGENRVVRRDTRGRYYTL